MAVARRRTLVRTIWIELVRPEQSDLSGAELWRIGRVAVAALIVGINLVGALAVVLIAAYLVPLPSVRDADHVRNVNFVAAGCYVVAAVVAGEVGGVSSLRRLRRWIVSDRPPTASDQRLVLRAPLRLFALQMTFWLVAAAGFAVLNAGYSGALALRVSITVALTGLSTAACAYLLTERALRSMAVRAMSGADPGRLAVPGLASRAVLAWALGTGVPLGGLVAIGLLNVVRTQESTTALAVAILGLGGTAITVGLLATGLAARASADPADAVRHALERVQRGDLTVQVPVYDGTQLGRLQLGFNRMVQGLRERELLRDAFGAYVDPQLAERVLAEGTKLEGEAVEVTVMFLDIRGFTPYAESRPAMDVVASLNRLFEGVVPVIQEHGGRVDSYIGDGFMAVFGAPNRLTDHADRALAAALEIARVVDQTEFRVGIGLNSGIVVAGAVGAAGRFEFSVIGDVVNTAARIEAATRETDDVVLMGERTRELLRCDVPLVLRPAMALKGKQEQVQLFAPDQTAARLEASAAPAGDE